MEFISKYQDEIRGLRKKLRRLEDLAQKERAKKEKELMRQGWVYVHVYVNPYEDEPPRHFLLSPEVDKEVVKRAGTEWFSFEEEGITEDQYFVAKDEE